eukprot:scaffold1891_cov62-Cylindrotheca_fusiformis.AAC.1
MELSFCQRECFACSGRINGSTRRRFLTTIDTSVRFRMTIPMENRSKDELFRSLDVALRYYNKADFKIKQIDCDGEFRVMMDEVQDELDVEMNYANPGDHVPEAERNNRTIKERVRVGYYRLPYRKFAI